MKFLKIVQRKNRRIEYLENVQEQILNENKSLKEPLAAKILTVHSSVRWLGHGSRIFSLYFRENGWPVHITSIEQESPYFANEGQLKKYRAARVQRKGRKPKIKF